MLESSIDNLAVCPLWLTHNYMENILRKYHKDIGLKVNSLDIKPATVKGDNYSSAMMRIRVEYEDGRTKLHGVNYIVKTSHENDPFAENIMKPYDCYNTEMNMYEKVLPQLTKLLLEFGDEDKLFAETLHVDYANSAIIFEDLAVSHFTVANRLKGMDMTHAQLALKKLAKMHATAAILNQRHSGCLEKFDHGIFNRHTRSFAPFFENMIEVCGDFAGECPRLGAYYQRKLKKLKDHVVEYATRVYDSKAEHFRTLIHGDFWINNVMLRYKSNSEGNKLIEDIKLIDFQFCSWSTPAVDLHDFFNTSLESQMRLNKQDELIQYYHAILRKSLQDFGYKSHIPTLHEFCVQMEEGRFIAVVSALVVQTIMINENTEDADIRALMSNDESSKKFRSMLYTQKQIQDNAINLLPYFDRKGLLDVED